MPRKEVRDFNSLKDMTEYFRRLGIPQHLISFDNDDEEGSNPYHPSEIRETTYAEWCQDEVDKYKLERKEK